MSARNSPSLKLCFFIFFLLIANEIRAFAEVPQWMQIENKEIEPPIHLSLSEQQTCASRLIAELNGETHASLSASNIASVRMPSWAHAEMGFVRGGGFNIRVKASYAKTDLATKRLHAGRFARTKAWFTLGAVPSLHLPDEIGGNKTFLETENAVTGMTDYDFVAHLDSGYAYLPIGLGLHLIRDLLGAKSRNPCPD
jgi:hypothetical protein